MPKFLPSILVLAALMLPAPASSQEPVGDAARGEALATSLGCAACHAGVGSVDEVRQRAPVLVAGGASLPAEFTFGYLAAPETRRPEIAPTRMPDFRLTEEERVALALYLAGGNAESGADTEVGRASAAHPQATAEAGAMLFRSLGCAGCHGTGATGEEPGMAPAIGPDLASVGLRLRSVWIGSFLAQPRTVRPAGYHPGTLSRMPDFGLSGGEVADLTAYLSSLRAPLPRVAAASTGRILSGPQAPAAEEPSPWLLARGESYLTARMSCLGCHSWRGGGGRIGPALDGAAARLTQQGLRAAVLSPRGLHPASVMPESPFRTDLLDDVLRTLTAVGGAGSGGGPPEAAAQDRRPPPAISLADRERYWRVAPAAAGGPDGGEGPLDGATVYDRNCALCHGLDGGGGGFNAPHLPVRPTPHNDAELMAARPDDTLFDGIHGGGWVLDRSHRMPAFGRSLSRPEIAAAVTYIRDLCRCQGPSWSEGAGPGESAGEGRDGP
jgi:mono/diheme cytochrome c family protein